MATKGYEGALKTALEHMRALSRDSARPDAGDPIIDGLIVVMEAVLAPHPDIVELSSRIDHVASDRQAVTATLANHRVRTEQADKDIGIMAERVRAMGLTLGWERQTGQASIHERLTALEQRRHEDQAAVAELTNRDQFTAGQIAGLRTRLERTVTDLRGAEGAIGELSKQLADNLAGQLGASPTISADGIAVHTLTIGHIHIGERMDANGAHIGEERPSELAARMASEVGPWNPPITPNELRRRCGAASNADIERVWLVANKNQAEVDRLRKQLDRVTGEYEALASSNHWISKEYAALVEVSNANHAKRVEAENLLATERQLMRRVGDAYDIGVKMYREAGGMERGDLPPVRAELLAWTLTRLENAEREAASTLGTWMAGMAERLHCRADQDAIANTLDGRLAELAEIRHRSEMLANELGPWMENVAKLIGCTPDQASIKHAITLGIERAQRIERELETTNAVKTRLAAQLKTSPDWHQIEGAERRWIRHAEEQDQTRNELKVTVDEQARVIEDLRAQLASANARADHNAAAHARVQLAEAGQRQAVDKMNDLLGACADQAIQISELRSKVFDLGGDPNKTPQQPESDPARAD